MKNNNFKISIDARAILEENKDGAAYYVTNLVSNLITSNNFDFNLYFDKDFSKQKFNSNVHTKLLSWPKIAWPQSALTLELFRNRNFDLYFSPIHSVPIYCPKKMIAVIYDLAFLKFKSYFKWFDRFMLTHLTTNVAVKKSMRLIAISNSTKKDIIKYYGIPEERITVIYPGYDKNVYYPRDIEQINIAKLKYKINGNYLIYVGTLQKRKNILRLIKAFEKILVKDKLNLKLVIAGKTGWMYDDIFTLVNHNVLLKKNVIFTGYVSIEDLPILISGAMYSILPSLYEGFGLPVLEAMACKTPVIVSDVSSLPEICGDAGLLINNPYSIEDIYNVLKKACTDNSLRQRLAEKCYERSNFFSWEKCASQTLNLFKEVINES